MRKRSARPAVQIQLPEEKLADEKAVENTHSANQSLTGFQAGSIYTETVLVSSIEYTCVNMKIPSWVNARTKCWGAANYGYTGLGNWSQTEEPYFVQYDSGNGMSKTVGISRGQPILLFLIFY